MKIETIVITINKNSEEYKKNKKKYDAMMNTVKKIDIETHKTLINS